MFKFRPFKTRGTLLSGVILTSLIIYVLFSSFFHLSGDPVSGEFDNGAFDRVDCGSATPYAEYYVSPTGNDGGSGTLMDPFKTISKAQEVVRTLVNGMTGDIIVYLRGGTYFLSGRVLFTPQDSGSGSHIVHYRNYPGETPVLSGGRVITGWEQEIDGVWVATSPVADARQLYVGGERATRARGSADFILSTTGDGHAVKQGTIGTWKNLQDVEFVYQDIWTLPRVRPYTIKDDFVYMQQPAYADMRLKPDYQGNPPIWVENARELLDEPGEWYLDKPTAKIYYLPRAGEDLTKTPVIVPALEEILVVNGTLTQKVQNLAFEGLHFQHASWLQPNAFGTCAVEAQAIVIRVVNNQRIMAPGSVWCAHARDLAFRNCSFSLSGSTGIHYREGVQESSITGCTFIELAGTGIQVGEITPTGDPTSNKTVKDIIVKNNYITNCCREFKSGVGIFGGYVRTTRIEHNTISNMPYTGISLGWGWSARETEMANNTVLFNRIYGIMNFLKDGGGIYTLSTQPGTNVSYNVIHDSGWNGLYPDERTNGTTWSYNVVWDTDNNFLDHSMYEEAKWNAVVNNYLEEYPLHLWVWYPERDSDQVWGLRPGDAGFPQAIVDQSGVEPAYAHLVPADEWHWQYERAGEDNPLASHPVVMWVFLVGFLGVATAGVVLIARGKPKPREVVESHQRGAE